MSKPRTPWRRTFDAVSHWLFVGFLCAVRCIPRRAAGRLGECLGLLWFWADGSHRRLALGNLRLALGGEKSPAELKRIARASFRHLGRVLVEMAWSWHLVPEHLERVFIFEGEENLLRARGQGKGIIAISAHVGNWELLSGHCLRHGRAHIVAKKIHNPGIDRWVRERRLRAGLVQIDPSGSVRQLLRLLREKEEVAFLLDQSAPASMGEPVDFFGHPAWTYTGAAALALKTGTPVITMHTIRRPDGRIKIVYNGPLELVHTGDRRRDVLENSRRFTGEIENWIRQHPEQWLWVHDRWRTRRAARNGGGSAT
jgi:KDO2-lipid IV(A) lauroyltransferase